MANRFRVRKALPDDIAAVVAIERRCFDDPWSADAFREIIGGPGLVATCADRVVGYLFASRVGDAAEILNVAVDPDQRRTGIGRALIGEVTDLLEADGVRKIFLAVRASNRAARKLYEDVGFAEVGTSCNYYGHPVEDAVVMARSIRIFKGLHK